MIPFFTESTKQPNKATATMMTAQSDPFVKDARPFTFIYPRPINGQCEDLYVVGNAVMWTDGTCEVYIERVVLNRRLAEVSPEVMQEIQGAARHHVSRHAFRKYQITSFKN